MTVVESLAAGVPAVVTRTCPWPEIEMRQCGFWVEQNVPAIAAALRVLADDPANRRRMGENAMAFARERFGWDAIATSDVAVVRGPQVMGAKELARKVLERAGFVVHRVPANRFEAMETSLRQLHAGGYRPRIVIDAGANLGQWFGLASSVFPEGEFHLIEPQEECWATLDAAAARRGRTHIHRAAVTAPGAQNVRMHRGGDELSTGAFVISDADSFPTDLTATAATLDGLFSADVTPDDRALLKLDIEGHEIEALRGAASLLERIEVVLCEVRFFDVYAGGAPVFGAVLAFLESRGFLLYDFASLSGRKLDRRLFLGDAIFIRNGSPLGVDLRLE